MVILMLTLVLLRIPSCGEKDGTAASTGRPAGGAWPIGDRLRGEGQHAGRASRASLAYLTRAAGNAAGARDQYAALLPIFELGGLVAVDGFC
jgi:hypothetical protein